MDAGAERRDEQSARVARAQVTALWAATFDATVVITVPGHQQRLDRLLGTLPFAPELLRLDSAPHGYDCRRHRIESNHHVIVGERHKRIVDDARRRGLRNVFVFEDDAEFAPDAGISLVGVLRWIQAHPDAWDVFYLGLLAPLLSRCSWVAPGVIRAHRPLFAHALCYHRRVFEAVLAVDLTGDHRRWLHQQAERLVSPGARAATYFAEGVGSIDSWLAYSRLERLASHPLLVAQSALPPGTAARWTRVTRRPYDLHGTPRTHVALALFVHYAGLAAGLLALVATAAWGLGRL